ncbi:MAG: FkbM family methyltransferase [Cytophagaceae bacterium]|nr:FkbM family methyltransferase [Cytophagaceae bacterium]
MLSLVKQFIWKIFTKIDTSLKFPNLHQGEIGIQLGFDMNVPVTTDLLLMYKRVKPGGMVLAVDADPDNVQKAKKIIEKNNLNIKVVHRAIYSEKGKVELLLGESASWNQLNNIPIDSTVKFTPVKVEVPMDTLDNIVKDMKIEIHKIGHINMTINGAEYFGLKGMHRILTEAENINLTIVAGRYDESGVLNGRPDHEMILELLHSYGYQTSFKRIHQLIWWGFFVKTLLNRKWIYGKKNYGIIFAAKGNKKLKWYQSFS